jgi:D-lyxose ketol-isomerase
MVIDMLEVGRCKAVGMDDNHDWGYQLRLVNWEKYCGKFLVLTNNKVGSIHYHKEKTETFITLSGKVVLDIKRGPTADVERTILGVGEQATLFPSHLHQMWAKEAPAVVLEVSTHDDDSDTYRLEDWP